MKSHSRPRRVSLPSVCLPMSKVHLWHCCLHLPEWPRESRTGAPWMFVRVEGTSWRETNLWCKLFTPTQLSLYPLSRCYSTSRKPKECLNFVSCFQIMCRRYMTRETFIWIFLCWKREVGAKIAMYLRTSILHYCNTFHIMCVNLYNVYEEQTKGS